jgi:hypothetical protein
MTPEEHIEVLRKKYGRKRVTCAVLAIAKLRANKPEKYEFLLSMYSSKEILEKLLEETSKEIMVGDV